MAWSWHLTQDCVRAGETRSAAASFLTGSWETRRYTRHEVPQTCLAPHWDLFRPFPTFRSELLEQPVWKCSLGSLSGLGTREDTSAPCQARSMPRCHLRAPALAQLTAAEELSHAHFNSAPVKCRQVLFFRYWDSQTSLHQILLREWMLTWLFSSLGFPAWKPVFGELVSELQTLVKILFSIYVVIAKYCARWCPNGGIITWTSNETQQTATSLCVMLSNTR